MAVGWDSRVTNQWPVLFVYDWNAGGIPWPQTNDLVCACLLLMGGRGFTGYIRRTIGEGHRQSISLYPYLGIF